MLHWQFVARGQSARVNRAGGTEGGGQQDPRNARSDFKNDSACTMSQLRERERERGTDAWGYWVAMSNYIGRNEVHVVAS